MKKIILCFGYISFAIILGLLASCQRNSTESQEETYTTTTLKVWGECEMCKETIENALKDVKGIKSATWDVETKILTLSYDSNTIRLAEIGQIIAEVGYDNELQKADDEAYAELPDCCQYERK